MQTFLNDIVSLSRAYPQLIIFLSLSGGYFIGKVKIFGFNLGSTAGVLVVALVIGQINVSIPPLLESVAFALFIYAIGYKVGPEFFGSLKKEGLNYIWLSIFVAVVGLITATILARLFGFDAGTAAGLLGGAMTQSSIIGTADGALGHMANASALESNVAIAYAITYIFGTAGLVIFFKLAPKIMKIDLKDEAKKLEQAMSGSSETLDSLDLFSWAGRLTLRTYCVTNKVVIGKKIEKIDQMFPDRVAIDKIKRDKTLFEPEFDTVLQANDVIAVVGNRNQLLKAAEIFGPEVSDGAVEDLMGEMMDVVVLSKDAAGKTLLEILTKKGHGCFVKRITRQGHELPLTKSTRVKKGDVLSLVGSKKDVETFIQYLGYPERITVLTDLAVLGLGCVLGTLLGLVSLPVFGIPITLGVGGGVLISGLFFGWLRAVHPTFGQIPGPAQWIFTDLGLNLFIACVGITAGPQALIALQKSGASLFFAGVILTLTPMILGIMFGKWVLRLNPVLLFGGLTGAGTITAALNAVKEEADSSAPALGYTVPYAFGNVLLTIWGAVIVHMVH